MARSDLWPVMGLDGLLGYVDPETLRTCPAGSQVSVELTNGSRLAVPRESLQQQHSSFYLPIGRKQILEADAAHASQPQPVHVPPPPVPPSRLAMNRTTTDVRPPSNEEFILQDKNSKGATASRSEPEVVVPVLEERMEVDRERIDTGGVRVTKEVHKRQEVVDEPIIRDVVAVERIAVNQTVDRKPEVREEDNVIIIPVVEEMLVVEKRLVVREEVRITRSRVVTREPQTVTLRREEAHVERFNQEERDAAVPPRNAA